MTRTDTSSPDADATGTTHHARDPYDRVGEVEDFGALDEAWAGTTVEWREVAGARTRLLRRDGAADGPLVLCVHGLGGAATNWLEVAEPLAAIGDVVAVDLPGFGETEPPRPTAARPVAQARFLATLLHELDRGPAVVIGNSMGGAIATLLAADHPELVARLVLLGPALPPKLPVLKLSRYQVQAFGPMLLPVLGPRLIRRRLRRMTFREQYDSMIDELVAHPERVPERVRRLGAANIARMSELRWRGPAFREATSGLLEMQMGLARPGLIDAIRRVDAPTLFVRGRDDALILHATTALVRRLRPDWTVEERDDLGHVPMAEDPTWVADRIAEWMREAEVTPLPVG